jgi:hypothetical protein
MSTCSIYMSSRRIAVRRDSDLAPISDEYCSLALRKAIRSIRNASLLRLAVLDTTQALGIVVLVHCRWQLLCLVWCGWFPLNQPFSGPSVACLPSLVLRPIKSFLVKFGPVIFHSLLAGTFNRSFKLRHVIFVAQSPGHSDGLA